MRILCAVFLVGGVALCWQAVLVRELLAFCSGSEFVLGFVVGMWVLCAGVGTVPFRDSLSRMKRKRWQALTLALTLLGIVCGIGFLWVHRDAVNLLPGQALEPRRLLHLAALAVGMPAMASGVLMTVAVAMRGDGSARDATAAVYGADCLGAAAGGMLLSWLLLPRCGPVEIGLLAGAAICLAGLLFLGGRVAAAVLGLCATAFVALVATGVGGRLDGRLRTGQWRPYPVIAHADTPYANLVVLDRDGERSLFASGALVTSIPYPDEFAAEETAHIPLAFLPEGSPRRALVLGSCTGGLIKEIRTTGAALTRVEIDAAMASMIRDLEGGGQEDEAVAADPRSFLRQGGTLFDAVYLDLPTPATLAANRHYTVESFRLLRTAVADQGVAVFRLPGSTVYLDHAARKMHRSILLAANQVFPSVRAVPLDGSVLYVCSPALRLDTVSIADAVARFQARALQTRLVMPPVLVHRLDPAKEARLRAVLDKTLTPMNRDLHPVAAFHGLRHLHAATSPGLDRLLGRLESVPFAFVAAVLLLLVALPAIPGGPAGLARTLAAGSGFSGMGLSMVLLFAWQMVSGCLYRDLALVMAVFMAGLGLANLLAARFLITPAQQGGSIRRPVLGAELAVAAFCLLLPGIATWACGAGRYALLPAVLAGGLLSGLEFALASRLHPAPDPGRRAGILFSLDLFGASLAALLVAAFLVPVYGLASACLLLALLKAPAALLALCAGRSSAMALP